MKYYQKQDSSIWAFEGDGSQDTLITSDMVLLSDAEVEAIVNPAPTLEEIKAAKWGEIKGERDRRKNGGVLIDGKWFHSDDASRIQQIALVMFGVSVPPVEWKTMDGTFVTMSQSLANDIFQGMAAADQTNFANAEAHRIAMEASAEPASYDFSSGWMPIYEEQ